MEVTVSDLDGIGPHDVVSVCSRGLPLLLFLSEIL